MRTVAKAVIPLGLGLLCSYATCASTPGAAPRPELPPEQTLRERIGGVDLLIVTLQLPDGQTVPCVVDTGAARTMLDQSLKASLGPRLQTDEFTFPFRAEGAETPGVQAAPKLCLGNVPLMTGPTILAGRVFDTNNCPYQAILGIDCLRHYCIQIDFDERKLRFLDPGTLKPEELGTAFPLSFPTNHGGMPAVDIHWSTNRNVRLMVDTGFGSPEFSLPPDVVGPSVQHQDAVDSFTSTYFGNTLIEIFRYPTVRIGQETCENVRVVQGEFGEKGWIDGFMGLPFLARHKVTFDFPNSKMYLKLRHPETGK